jgi:hypothetical protein
MYKNKKCKAYFLNLKHVISSLFILALASKNHKTLTKTKSFIISYEVDISVI